MKTMSTYFRVMRTPNTLFLLVYSPLASAKIVHLRGKLYRSITGDPRPIWVDIRANDLGREFLNTIIARAIKPGPDWKLSALTDASEPDF